MDHKPLVLLLSSKHLNDLPPRVLRFRLRMAKFDYTIFHVPGKLLYVADTLPIPSQNPDPLQEVETFANSVPPGAFGNLPTISGAGSSLFSSVRVLQIRFAKEAAHLTGASALLESHRTVLPFVMVYCCTIRESSFPNSCRKKRYNGHLGIEKCRKHTSSSVWWPGVMQQITQLVQNCQVCLKKSKPGKEPLSPIQISMVSSRNRSF